MNVARGGWRRVVALAATSRGLQASPPGERVALRGMLVLMLAGETAALAAVGGLGDRLLSRGLVLSALVWSGLFVTLYAAVGRARIGADRRHGRPGAPQQRGRARAARQSRATLDA